MFIHSLVTMHSVACARRQGSGEGQGIDFGDRRLDFGSNATTANVTLHRSPALPGPLFRHPQERLQQRINIPWELVSQARSGVAMENLHSCTATSKKH